MKVARVCLFIFLFNSPKLLAGNFVGNGGDSEVEEFYHIIRTVVNDIRKCSFVGKRETSLVDEIEKVIIDSKIYSHDGPLVILDRQVDAINYPETNTIVFDRSRWKDLPYGKKIKLTIHEFLWLAGYNETNYYYTHQVIRWRNKCQFNPIPFY